MPNIERWIIGMTWTAPYFEGDDSWAGVIRGPRLESINVEVVRADAYRGAVEVLQRIATTGGHAHWRIAMAREWLEANGHPTTYGGR